MLTTNRLLLLAAATLALPIGACMPATEDGQDCSNGHCDDPPDSEVPASPCDGIIVDESGAGHQKVIGRNGDPLAKLAWSGEGCPTNFQDIMAKLRQTDTEGCPGETDGLSTRLISETAQATGTPTSYRAVTTRRCGNRGTEGIVFSLFGLRAGQTQMPAGVEMIAFDETAGVFNYYETDGRTLNFFGSSKDMLQGADGQVRRCAACHTGGGLIMKELDTPWLHWEGHENTPGAQELVDANKKDLGSKNSGAEFEGVVKSGNTKWNKTKVEFLKQQGDIQALLKPLFCPVQINLDNGADFKSPVQGGAGGDQLSRIPFDSLVDPNLKGFGSISVTFQDYDDLIKANGQRVGGVPGAIDTIFDYVFLERSHEDNDYISQLKAAGIVDDDFIKDVVMVDFTRPVFSDDRCGLLTLGPRTLENINAQSIREAFITALSAESPAEGSPAAVLLANLQATGDGAAHDAKVTTFLDACKNLGSRPFLTNALAITSLNRDKARERPIMEFESTMPSDSQSVDPNARLHPQTCNLVNSFVAP
jgi:hypothetical protein